MMEILESRDLPNLSALTNAKRSVMDDTEIAVYKQALSEPGVLTAALNYYRANVLDRFFSSAKTEAKNDDADLNELRADNAQIKPGVNVPTLRRAKLIEQKIVREITRKDAKN